MTKLIVTFKHKADAREWLVNVKKNDYVIGGNVYKNGSYRAMVYGDITPERAAIMSVGHSYSLQ